MDKVMVTQEELRDRIAAGLRLAETLACDVPITTQARDTLNHAKDALARLSPAPEGVDARELLAKEASGAGPEIYSEDRCGMVSIGSALRAIDAALALSRPPAEQVRMREALEEATEAIGVCIDGFEKSNPTLGGLAAIHMLKEARERYRTILALTPPPKGQNDGA